MIVLFKTVTLSAKELGNMFISIQSISTIDAMILNVTFPVYSLIPQIFKYIVSARDYSWS